MLTPKLIPIEKMEQEDVQIEKWQPKTKVATSRNKKSREGYMNIGHHAGRQNLAHGVVEQMEKGDTPMVTDEQQRLNNTVVQLEKIAGLGAIAGAAKKVGGAVSGAAKKLGGGGGDSPKTEAPKANFYDTAKVSGPKADSRDWKVQSTPAIDTSPYGKDYERVRTDVTEKQRAQRTGDPIREKRQPVKQTGTAADKSSGSRLARAFGATKRAAGDFGRGFSEGAGQSLGGFSRRGSSGGGKPASTAERTGANTGVSRKHIAYRRKATSSSANPYGDAASREKASVEQARAQRGLDKKTGTKPKSAKKPDARAATKAAGLHYAKMEKAVVSLQKYVDDCGCDSPK